VARVGALRETLVLYQRRSKARYLPAYTFAVNLLRELLTDPAGGEHFNVTLTMPGTLETCPTWSTFSTCSIPICQSKSIFEDSGPMSNAVIAIK
jgi:hypothetical protein